jgi:tetratricopeptide (TPR) repeat protein
MRTFNVRLFVYLLGCVVALTAAVLLVHWLQTGRIAHALLDQARRREEQGDRKKAAQFLGRYLEFVPDDVEQRANLGRVLSDVVLSPDKGPATTRECERALFVLEQVTARAPDRVDSQRRLARVALLLGRPELALEHLQKLPEDGDGVDLTGQALAAQQKYGEAAAAFFKAIHVAPGQRETYSRLAALLRRADRPSFPKEVKDLTADAVLNQLVQNNGQSFQAYLQRWRSQPEALLQDPKKFDEAAGDVETAVRLAPDEADVILAAADLARRRADRAKDDGRKGFLGEARRLLDRGKELHLKDPRMYLARADLHLAEKDPKGAVACLDQGLERMPAQVDLLWLLANLLIDYGKDKELPGVYARVGKVVERMKAAGSPASSVDYVLARGQLFEGNHEQAARLFEGARLVMERDQASPGLLNQVDLYLAECYERMQETEKQVTALERLKVREEQRGAGSPALVAALQGLVAVKWSLGSKGQDEAITLARKLTKLPGGTDASHVALINLLVARVQQKGRPNWKEVDDALTEAHAAFPQSIDLPLLNGRVLALQKKLDDADKQFAAVAQMAPDRPEPWVARSALADFKNEPDKAQQLLEECERQTGDSVVLRLGKARYWSHHPDDKGAPDLMALAANTEKLKQKEGEEARLLQGLSVVCLQAGKVPQARELWARLTQLPGYRDDMNAQLALLDLTLEAKDTDRVAAVLEEIKRIEGKQGACWSYAEGQRLLAKQDAAGARRELDKAVTQRPKWSAAHVALARVELLEGNPEAALAQFRAAFDLGERSPRMIQEFCGLLRERRLVEEVDRVLKTLPQQSLVGDLDPFKADMLVREGDLRGAIDVIRAQVASDPKDYRAFLNLGKLLAAAGKPRQAEAEQHLRKAVELAGDVPETWVTLVEFLVATDQKDKAAAEVDAARARVPEAARPLILALCCEAAGRTDDARKEYQQALRQKPDDAAALREAVRFHVTGGRPGDAEALLQPVLDGKVKLPAADAEWARRAMALVLASRNDYGKFLTALGLLGLAVDTSSGVKVVETKAPPKESVTEEQRARAEVLATQPRKAFRSRAIELLEGLASRQALTAEDRVLLAQLYEDDGNATRAGEQYGKLAQGPNPQAVALYVHVLLHQGDAGEAQRFVSKLADLEKSQKVEPGAFGSVELQAQVWELQTKGKDAVELLKKYAGREGARPADLLVLAACQTRQKLYDDALKACEAAAAKDASPEAVALVSVGVVRAARAEPRANKDLVKALADRVRPPLENAAREHPASVVFPLQLATLAEQRDQLAAAAAAYREVLKRDRDNLVALNNLAWILAQPQGDANEAMRLVKQAIDRYGEQAELLDTRATVYLALDQPAQAVADLERATAEGRVPARLFHLAQAHEKAGKRTEARQAWQAAKEAGLKAEHLPPPEQMAFRKLADDLER